MKVVTSLDLDRSREQVWEKFDSFENLKLWQPTLIKHEHISGEPGQIGAVTLLTYDEDGREIVLEETITQRIAMEEFCAVYEAGSVTNTIRNQFADLSGNRTRWTLESDFQFRGLYRLMSIFMGGSLRKQTEETMRMFQQFVESS